MKVQTLLSTKGSNVFTVSAQRSIRDASSLLMQHNIGAVVVTDAAGRLAGILSERDVVRAVARREDVDEPISHIMTRDVTVGSPNDELSAVVRTMTERRFRHLPVMEHGQLVGLVSIGDLVKAQLTEYQGEIETLLTQDEG